MIDPVSKNEVPPGSKPVEVRDNVDAKLSEGEYVVPADVVRYFGVGYFERLREKAKKSMAEMAADGRVAGHGGEEEDFPFMEDDLEFEDDGEEEPQEAPEVQMATGGAVLPSVEGRTYKNAAGQTTTIMFRNGSPLTPIPAGYTPAAVQAPTAPRPTIDAGQGSDRDPNDTTTENRYSNPKNLDNTELLDYASQIADQKGIADTLGKAIGMAGPMGALIGGLVSQGSVKTARDFAEEIDNRVKSGTMTEDEARKARESLAEISQKEDDKLFGGSGLKGIIGKGVQKAAIAIRQKQELVSNDRQMAQSAPTGMKWDVVTKSYKPDNNKSAGENLGGTRIGSSDRGDVDVYSPGEDTPRPERNPRNMARGGLVKRRNC